jgi:TRAP-type uncharacterized transport system substrate-binding protein
MDFYSVKPGDLGKIPLADIAAALPRKQVAAVVAIGSAGPGTPSEKVRSIVRATGKPPGVIDREATEIAVHNPLYEEITIPAGAFPAVPAIPDDEVNTGAVRLVAKNSMLNDVARNITRLLLTTLAKFAATMPVAGQIRLSEIEEELDTLSGWLLERFLYEKIAPERINGVAFIISHSRLVIERRRKAA